MSPLCHQGARQWYLALFSCVFTFFVEEVSTGPMTPGFPTQTFFLARYVRAHDLALGVARLVCHLHHVGLSH